MTTVWLDALNEAWDELAETAPVSREYRTRLISRDISLDIDAGMRAADDAPCLMLQATTPAGSLFELGGMRLTTVPDARGPLLVLSLEDRSRRDLFSTICADVVAVAAMADRDEALGLFISRLDAWRQFLRDQRDGLLRAETIGLIGELLVLREILQQRTNGLASWESPGDGLHDFSSAGHALEVKTGLGPASRVSISRLDQLDSSGLRRLDLLHVRLIESPGGQCLRDLITDISDRLPGSMRRSFENALLSRGLMPDDDAARSAPVVDVRSIDAYTVTDEFPRLTRSTLPLAISDVTYALEVRALSAFQADLAEVLDAFNQGGNA